MHHITCGPDNNSFILIKILTTASCEQTLAASHLAPCLESPVHDCSCLKLRAIKRLLHALYIPLQLYGVREVAVEVSTLPATPNTKERHGIDYITAYFSRARAKTSQSARELFEQQVALMRIQGRGLCILSQVPTSRTRAHQITLTAASKYRNSGSAWIMLQPSPVLPLLCSKAIWIHGDQYVQVHVFHKPTSPLVTLIVCTQPFSQLWQQHPAGAPTRTSI